MNAKSEPQPPAGVESSPFSRAHGLMLLRKHLPMIVACCLASGALALFWTLGQAKTYRAEALLRIESDAPKPLGTRVEMVQAASANYWNRREFYESEFRIMRSMRVATATVSALGLNADPGFMGVKAKERASFKAVSVQKAAQLLITRLTVEPVKDSTLAMLRYEDVDPKRAQTVLNAVVKTYLSQNLDVATSVSTTALEWLNMQLERLKVDLEKSEVALNDFRQKNNVLSISLEDRHNMITAQLEQIAKDATTLEVKKYELAARNAELAKVKSDDPLNLPATELLQSSVLSKLRTDYADARKRYEEESANLGAVHPKVLSAQAEVTDLAKSIASEVENIKGAARRDLASTERQLGDLDRKELDIQRQAHELQAFEIPYNQLDRTRSENTKIYNLVLERARETELTRVMNFNNIRVIDEAEEPTIPYKPNVPVNIAAGVILGLAIGISAAAGREFTDRSLKTPLDVETVIGCTCLGLIPEISQTRRGRAREKAVPAALQDRDLVVARHPEGGVSEAARAIRTNLTFMSPDRPYRTILVTSAIPEEGKTTVACSLATVFAQNGQRVLIVDTDLRRPRLHRTFRVTNEVGVTMAVSNQATLEECIHETSIPNLWVLTSGPLPPNPAELLQSERFAALVKELTSRFDRVVFDSPPILPVTDAAILSRLVDGVVAVARGFRTQKSAARQAIKQLVDVKAHVIGMVLNAIDLSRHDYREYHYYYKRDGYYTSDAPRMRPLPTSGENLPPPAA